MNCFDSILNPLPSDKIVDWSKLKAFAEDIINVNEILKFRLGRVENTGTRRKCCFPAVSPFSTFVF